VIRAVCFDVAGVMTHPIGPAFAAQATAAGIDLDEAVRSTMVDFSTGPDGDRPAHRLERGEITLVEFMSQLHPDDRATRLLMDPASEFFVPRRFEPHAVMHQFVQEVRERGYRTALITNSVVEWLPWWDRVLPDGDVFDVVVHSCRVGLRKPDPAIYRLALDRLGVQPAEAMFLDDFEAMADAAREVGMHVVHVTEHAAALRDARALLDQHV